VIEEYNSFGQPVRRTTAGLRGEDVFQEFLYDHRQRLSFEWRPHVFDDDTQHFIAHEYDELDRRIKTTLADGAVIEHRYAPDVNTGVTTGIAGAAEYVKTIDPRGKATIVALNNRGQTAGVTNAAGATTIYEYGPFDQLTAIRDGDQDVVRVDHDDYGRATNVLDLARGATSETTVYDAFDQVVRTKDAANRVQRSFYDDFGRLERLEDPDGQTTWIYDGTEQNEIGRVVETVSSTGQQTFYGYQPRENGRNRGLLSRITQRVVAPPGGGTSGEPLEMTTDYHYDGNSRLNQIDYPGPAGTRFSVAYAFDDFGHPIEARAATGTNEVYWALVDAFQGYRARTERVGSASCNGEPGTRTVRTYNDRTGTLENITSKCGTRVLQNLTYGYDASRGMSARADNLSGMAESFVNDDLDRISQQDGFTAYTYEGLSSRLSGAFAVGPYTYDQEEGRDWVRTAGPSTFEHDAVGNIRLRNNPAVPGGTQTITYTTFDLPRTITNSAGTTSFLYDSSGARVLKQTATKTIYYAGDLYQRSVNSAGVAENMWMVYAGGRAVAQATSNDSAANLSDPTLRYLYDDALGSVQAIADADGVLVGARNYSPFGIQRNAGGLDTEVPFGFTGHHMDPELGLINMGGRIYDPHLGQFLTADPVMTEPAGGGLNRFAYVNNGPLDATDPTGLWRSPIDFNSPDHTAFPGIVNQPGPSSAGSTGTIQPSAASPGSPASAGAQPGGTMMPGGDGAELSPGDAASMGDVVGYAGSNGPALYQAGRVWAKSAEYQPNTYQAVPMSRTAAAVDGAVPGYGNSSTGLGTGGVQEGPDRRIAGAVVNGAFPEPGKLSVTEVLRRELIMLVEGGPTWAIYSDEELQRIAEDAAARGETEWAPTPWVEAGAGGALRHLSAQALKVLLKRTAFGALRDHFARHGARFAAAEIYFFHAVRHLNTARNFVFRHDGVFKRAAVSRLENGKFWFTSGSLSGRRIFTSLEVNKGYLQNIGIKLPKGF
jgi:RHS repeat-associated protein